MDKAKQGINEGRQGKAAPAAPWSVGVGCDLVGLLCFALLCVWH